MDANVHQIMQYIMDLLIMISGWLVKEAIQYLSTLRKNAILEYGAKNYNHMFNVATSIYHIVEEEFRDDKGASESKRMLFDHYFQTKFPALSISEISHFRQAVCGEINSEVKKSDLFKPAPEFDPSIDEADIVNK